MNKAFIREPDPTVNLCPRCSSKREPVGNKTLAAYLTEEQKNRLVDPAKFCPSAQCPVA